MSFDLVMRTLGVVACLYTVAYFVTSTSVAALNAVTFNSVPMCGETGCVTVAEHRPRLMPGQGRDGAPLWLATSFLQND